MSAATTVHGPFNFIYGDIHLPRPFGSFQLLLSGAALVFEILSVLGEALKFTSLTGISPDYSFEASRELIALGI